MEAEASNAGGLREAALADYRSVAVSSVSEVDAEDAPARIQVAQCSPQINRHSLLRKKILAHAGQGQPAHVTSAALQEQACAL